LIGGEPMLSPLGSSEAYVGFQVSAEPTGPVALDIGYPQAYRIDLSTGLG
jgi:hypothetical protein